jgi:hypothetical protein
MIYWLATCRLCSQSCWVDLPTGSRIPEDLICSILYVRTNYSPFQGEPLSLFHIHWPVLQVKRAHLSPLTSDLSMTSMYASGAPAIGLFQQSCRSGKHTCLRTSQPSCNNRELHLSRGSCPNRLWGRKSHPSSDESPAAPQKRYNRYQTEVLKRRCHTICFPLAGMMMATCLQP